MPQVDLETLVSACAGVSCDSKVACETIASTAAENHHSQQPQPQDDDAEQPDLPPESFWLSKDAEFDWFDRNAFIERKDSTKGNSHSTNLNPNINNLSNSQRFSNLKTKPSIIGLPKPQKAYVSEARRHGKPGNTRLFPKRSGSNAKSDSSMVEPSSPKVSCMGRVRSKRDRNRRLKNRQRSVRSSEAESKREKPARKQRSGILAGFRAIFGGTSKHARKGGKDASQRGSSVTKSSDTAAAAASDVRERLRVSEREAPPRMSVDSDGFEPAAGAAPVGLGGLKKFASGRKSESWIDVA